MKKALVWIFVIVALSSFVSAGIVDSYATGEFGAPGFRGREDVVSFVARVFVGGDNLITSSQVHWRTAGSGPWTNFNDCIATTSVGVFDCYYVAGADNVVTSDSISYEVRLVSDTNNLVESKSVSVIVDTLTPTVSGVDFNQNSDGLKVIYSFTDKACNSAACVNKCSSIRRIEIFENDALIDNIETTNIECSLSTSAVFKPSGAPNFGGSAKTYKVKFYDGAGNSVDGGVSRSVFVDNYPPIADEDSFKLVDSVTGRIVHGFENGVSGRGVAGEIMVSDDIAVSKAVIDFYGTKYIAACTSVGGSNYRCTWGSLGILDSVNTVGGFFVDAYDTGGNSQRIFATYPIGVEKTGPSLVDFRLIKDGKEVSVLGTNPSNILLSARVKEEYPGLGSVSLTVNGAIYSPSCVDVSNGLYDCKVTLNNVVNSGSITVAISGTDNAGNSGSGTLTKTFNVDKTAPIITYLGSEHRGKISSNYDSYFGSDSSKVIAEITEDALDSALLSVNGANSIQGSCELVSAGKYLCSWSLGSFNHGDVVSLEITVKDKAGNIGTRTSSVFVDKVAPAVSLVDVLSINGNIRTTVHKVGDYLVINVQVSDDSPVYVEYDFMSIGYSSVETADCDIVNGVCEVLVDPIPASFSSDGSLGGILGDVKIKIFDAVGNFVEASTLQVGNGIERSGSSLRLSALQPDNDFNPNFWKATVVSSSPNALDRVLATKTYQRIGFSLRLDKVQSNSPVSIGDVILYNCDDERGIYSNQQIYNAQGENPVVMVELSQLNEDQILDLDETTIICELGIISKNKNVVYKPEIEKVNLTVKYFNTPLGIVDDRLTKKIEDAKTRFAGPDSGLGKLVGQTKKIMVFADGMCKTLETVDKISKAFTETVAIFSSANTLSGGTLTPVSSPICYEASAVNTVYKDTLSPALKRFCKVLSCEVSLFDGINEEQQKITDKELTNTVPAGEDGRQIFSEKTGLPVTYGELGFKAGDVTGYKMPDGKEVSNSWYEWTRGEAAEYQPGTADTTKELFGKSAADSATLTTYVNPRDNLPMAIFTFCLPGIVDGLEKYRQIECGYIDCLQSQVPAGVPIEACESSRAVSVCKQTYGETAEFLSALVPFYAMLNSYAEILRTALQDPLSALQLGLGAYCTAYCAEGGLGYDVCVATEYASLIGDLYKDITGWKGYKPFEYQNNVCDNI